MKYILILGLMLLGCSCTAFAQEATAVMPPDWLISLLGMAENVPYVGPVVVFIVKWAALISGVMTAIATFMMMLSVSLQGAGVMLGFRSFAEKVKYWSDKIMPWVKMLSIYNVQKKPPEMPKL